MNVRLRVTRAQGVLTGGAETRLGRVRLTSSEYISAKSLSGAVLGGATKPSLSWMLPVAWVELRVETRLAEMSCLRRGA